eukprot:774491-Rhodomonas_salina.2
MEADLHALVCSQLLLLFSLESRKLVVRSASVGRGGGGGGGGGGRGGRGGVWEVVSSCLAAEADIVPQHDAAPCAE